MSDIQQPKNIAIEALALPEIVNAIAQHIRFHWVLAKACLVCKAWKGAWTPFLWRNLNFNRTEDEIPSSIRKYGYHVKSLDYHNPEDPHLELVLPFCPNLQRLVLTDTFITMRVLAPFLKKNHFGRTLRSIELEVYAIQAKELLPILAKHCRHLEYIDILFMQPDMSVVKHSVLMRLLKSCSHLRELALARVSIVDDDDGDGDDGTEEIMGEEGTSDGTDEEGEEIDDQSRKQSRLEILDLGQTDQSDKSLLELLQQCSNLLGIYFGLNGKLTDNFIVKIPDLCPKVDSLSFYQPLGLTSSGIAQLLQGTPNNCLELRYLKLTGSPTNDQMVKQVAYSQAQSLVTLNLQRSSMVTDDSMEAILKYCCRLKSLLLKGTNVTPAIMQGPQDNWGCYETLDQLDIRGIGILSLPRLYDPEDWRIENNREVFKIIKRRIEMLPNLERLAMSFFGLRKELIQGFGNDDDGDGRESQENGTENDSEKQGVKVDHDELPPPPPLPPTANVSKKRVRLQVLSIQGMVDKFSAEDFSIFLKNYPSLRVLMLSGGRINSELEHMLRVANIKYQDPREMILALDN
ncbi:hypothetical protein BGX21_009187 [Mortierella sp. AD011]|nr:hypothetical protein BGX20_009032 [Mortierella sp. AD010]KAF9397128.1 hypothetical protein BGX21_009187 [Mortierella sp. AD011]